MKVREANIKDKEKWDFFVDTEAGSFFHYFNWKYIYEVRGWKYIPLLLENKESQVIGILPIVKKKNFLHSILSSLPEGSSGGVVLKKGLANTEKSQAFTMLLKYVDENYARSCSTFTLNENLQLGDESRNEPTKILIDNGFHFRHDNTTGLPCTYFLELKQSFEDNIWNGLWGYGLRRQIRKSKKKGVYVRKDKNLQYLDEFIDMLSVTFKRKGSVPLRREEVIKRLTAFNNKTKVFVAFLDGKPIASVLCYYTDSTCYCSKSPSYSLARENNANKLLVCEAIKDACENDYQYLEFGTTVTRSSEAWKNQFKGIKIPRRTYEKRYSTIRTIIQKTPALTKWAWNNKRYIWNNRRELIGKMIKVGI